MIKANDLREMDSDELISRLAEAGQELFNLRFQLVTGQLDNSARVGEVRKDIARVNTILREKEIAAAEAIEAEVEAARLKALTERRARTAAHRRVVVAGVGREAREAGERRTEQESHG